MFHKLTAQARRAIVLAPDEARRFNHDYIGTEHLLLALIHDDDAAAAQALQSLGITSREVRGAFEKVVVLGAHLHVGNIPFTPAAKNALEQSSHEALQLGHDYICTGHILLSLITATRGDGSKFLASLSGSNSNELHVLVSNYLADHPSAEQPPA
jgi:ATP-dependent Clp protease ATP-binding subunit ClpC